MGEEKEAEGFYKEKEEVKELESKWKGEEDKEK